MRQGWRGLRAEVSARWEQGCSAALARLDRAPRECGWACLRLPIPSSHLVGGKGPKACVGRELGTFLTTHTELGGGAPRQEEYTHTRAVKQESFMVHVVWKDSEGHEC